MLVFILAAVNGLFSKKKHLACFLGSEYTSNISIKCLCMCVWYTVNVFSCWDIYSPHSAKCNCFSKYLRKCSIKLLSLSSKLLLGFLNVKYILINLFLTFVITKLWHCFFSHDVINAVSSLINSARCLVRVFLGS